MNSLILSLDQFELYFKGGSSRSLKKFMKKYDRRLLLLDKHFKQTKISDPEIIKHVKSLLRTFNIPEEQWDNYFSSDLTVYGLLQKLSRQGYMQATYIVELIDKKTSIKTAQIFFLGFIGLTIVGSILLTPGAISLLQVILACAFTMPIVSLAISLATTIFYTYLNITDKKRPLFDRIRDIFFDFAKTIFTVIGYGILFAYSAVMNPVVASFFVFSSILDVVKEVFCLIQQTAQYKINKPVGDKEALGGECANIRHKVTYSMHRNALIINLSAAVLFVAIMAASSFIPFLIPISMPVLLPILSVGLTAAVIAVHVVKQMALKINEEVMRGRLQKQLKKAEHQHLETSTPECSDTNSFSSSFTEDNSFEKEYKQSTTPKRPQSFPFTHEKKTGANARFSFFSQSDKSTEFNDKHIPEPEFSPSASFSGS